MDKFFRGPFPDDPFREFRVFFGGLDDDDNDDDFDRSFFGGGELFRQMETMMEELNRSSNQPTDVRDRLLKNPNDPHWRRPPGRRQEEMNGSAVKEIPPMSPLDGQPVDRDLDKFIANNPSKLDEIIPGRSQSQPRSGSHSVFSSVTISTKQHPDGTIETTRRERDSHGNDTVSVTRSNGNKQQVDTKMHPERAEESRGTSSSSSSSSSSVFDRSPRSLWRNFWNAIWPGRSS